MPEANLLTDVIFPTLTTVQDVIKDAEATVKAPIDSSIDKTRDVLTSVVASLLSPVISGIQSVSDNLFAVSNHLERVIGRGLEDARQSLDDTRVRITDPIQTSLVEVNRELTNNLETVKSSIATGLQDTRDTIKATEIVVQGEIAASTKEIESNAVSLAAQVNLGFTERFQLLLTELTVATEKSGLAAGNSETNFWGGTILEAEPKLLGRLQGVLDLALASPAMPEVVKPLLKLDPKNPGQWQWLVGGFIASSVLQPLMNARMAGFITLLEQESLVQTRPTIPPPVDLTTLTVSGQIGNSEFVEAMRRLGYREGFIDKLSIALEKRLPPDTLDSLARRGFLDPEEAKTLTRLQGYSQTQTELIHLTNEVLPSVSDLVTMAVKEAFTPEIATKFGQFENLPEPFVREAKRQGLSEEWASRYWAAHWVLPSPTQGFEMFQRGIITHEELLLLLRALDIMPFWRDKLINLNYNPLTRVDIRRMYDQGVLKETEVLKAYLDLGYNPQNAERLTEFVVRLNDETQKRKLDHERDLTKAEVLSGMITGLITEADAKIHLKDLGYDDTEADFFIRKERFLEAKSVREQALTIILIKAKQHTLTEAQAFDAISKLGMAAGELATANRRLQLALLDKVTQPSKADLVGFAEAGLITEKEFAEGMLGLGYAEKWVKLFEAELGLKIKGKK